MWGVNDRLQPFQAVVGTHLLDQVEDLVERRIRNARLLDDGLTGLTEFVHVPDRPSDYREVYQLYQIGVQRRHELLPYLLEKGVECKVHYPIPLHLQEAAVDLGYQPGDFPVCERQAAEILTIPAHQHIEPEQIAYVIETIYAFYRR